MFICLFVLLLISIPADHKASFSFFMLACVCPRIVSLPVSLPAIISFCFSTEMLTFFYASKSVCLFVRLFVWHLPVFLAISIFISFEFVTYSLYLSVITYHFLFDFIHPSIGAEFKTLSPSRMVYTYPSAVWVSLLN